MKHQLSLQSDVVSAVAPAAGKIRQGKPKSGGSGTKFEELVQRANVREGANTRQAKIPSRQQVGDDVALLVKAEPVAVEEHESDPLLDKAAAHESTKPVQTEEPHAETSPPATPDLMFLSIAAAQNLHKAFATPSSDVSQHTVAPDENVTDEPEAPQPDIPRQLDAMKGQSRSKAETADHKTEPSSQFETANATPASKFVSPATTKAKPEPITQQPEFTLTLTKVETALLPAAPAPVSTGLAEQAGSVEPSIAIIPAPALPDATPAPSVVKTIHFQLQPEHLGELKVSMHLKGDGLRLTVEVTTREAHAALQRDTSYLREVLEKAGYDVAEQSVAVTLRLEPAPAQQPSSGGEGFSFTRSNSGEQSFQAAGHGQQQRQPSRQLDKEQGDAQANRNVQAASPTRSATGVYI